MLNSEPTYFDDSCWQTGQTLHDNVAIRLFWSESDLYVDTGDESVHSSSVAVPEFVELSVPQRKLGEEISPAPEHMRGGFRYVKVLLQSGASLNVRGLRVRMTAAPDMEEPRRWCNHFMSADHTLNRVWWGCGWCAQLCAIDRREGRNNTDDVAAMAAGGWRNNGTASIYGHSALVDGAKRDRMIWGGDLGISTQTLFATVGGTHVARNSLQTLMALADPDGMIARAGPPFAFKHAGKAGRSDTYHLWSLISTCHVGQYGRSTALSYCFDFDSVVGLCALFFLVYSLARLRFCLRQKFLNSK